MSVTGQACYQKGWINNPSVSIAYLNSIQANLRNRGNKEYIAQLMNRLETSPEFDVDQVTVEACRQFEMLALQYAQKEAERARQKQQYREAVDNMSQSAQKMQSQNKAITTTCQYNQWSNTTSCSSY